MRRDAVAAGGAAALDTIRSLHTTYRFVQDEGPETMTILPIRKGNASFTISSLSGDGKRTRYLVDVTD